MGVDVDKSEESDGRFSRLLDALQVAEAALESLRSADLPSSDIHRGRLLHVQNAVSGCINALLYGSDLDSSGQTTELDPSSLFLKIESDYSEDPISKHLPASH